MRVVDSATIRSLVTPAAALAAVSQSLIALAAGRAVLPDQIEVAVPGGGVVHVKGGLLTDSPWLSFKAAAGEFPGAPNAGCTLVLAATTGAPVALLDDGGWLTEMRTAAAAALATTLLARDDSTRVAVLGAGAQARFQIEAMRSARPDWSYAVWGRDAAKAQAVVDEVGGAVAAGADAAVVAADVVVTVTSAREPVLLGAWLRPGMHVTAVGADTRGKRELDAEALDRADVLVCDDVTLSARVGELQHGPRHRVRALGLPALAAREVAGRTARDQITLVDLCGLGVEDAAMADLVMTRLGS